MEQIKFWQNWHKPEKNAYLAGLFMFLFILIYYTVAFFAGNGWTYPWQIINNFETVEVPFYQLLTGLYNFNIGGNNYVNLQEFVGDTISISAWQAYILLAILMAALSVLMAIVSSLKRFWFFALLTILIFLFLLLQMDSLEFFGQYNRYGLIFGLALYILPAYVINNFFDHVGLLKRFIIFFITSTAFLICIYFFAGVENPLFHFISYGLAMPIILSVIFVLIIAHDIVSFFMLIITNSNNEYSKNSDIHFVIITLLYLLSLTFTYLYEIEYIKWDLIYINPFLLLLIAGVIGIWEFRKKRIAYQEIMHFSPVGAFFYVAMASICFATLAYFMATANDAALEAFTELILASQIGFGLTFFIYALVNFFTILHQNQAVYKVLYKPTRMPYFTANLAGFIATLAFFLSANYDMYYEARAAIYNAMGDVAFFNKQQPLAEELYTQSTIYGFKNHHAHYALGSIELQQQKPGEALYYFEEAIKKEPTENAYAIIANLYKSNDKFFEALFTIQDGLKNFPESGRLMSNAALLYNKTAVVDSTLYYLESAAATDQHDAAIANQHGIYALNNLTFTTDSIIDLYQDATTIENMTNLLVLLNYQGETKQKLPFLLQGDTTLSFNEYAYLQNFMTYQADYFDTTQLNSFHEFADDAVDYFSEPMLFNYAISLYKNQQVYQAYERLEQLANQSIDKESFYFKVMGLLALESGAPLLAQEFLENSAAIKNESADLEKPMLMTYLQAQDLETLSSRILINRQRFENKYPTLVKFVDLYAADSVDWLQQSDSLQYLAVKFLPEVSPGLAYEINTPFLRNDALLISGQRALQANNYSQAQDLLAAVDLLDENTLAPRKARLGMKYLWHTQQRDSLSEFINQENPLIDLYPLHFQAKLAEAGGDNDLAEQLYSLAGNMSPFAEDVVIDAARYFEQAGDYLRAYEIMVKAIKINRYSADLIKKYMQISLKMGLETFASSALETYRNKVSYQKFDQLSIYYDSLRQNITEEWQ